MFAFIKWLIMTVYNLLPDSPFSQMVDNLNLNQDFMQYLNWFLPLDIVGTMMLAWLDCMLIYIVFRLVSWIITKLVTLFISTIGSFTGFFI